MASSVFLVNYIGGQPELTFDDIVAYDPETESYYGGWSVMEDVIDENQANVKMLVMSSMEKLNILKMDNRFTWVEDVEGWTE